MLREKQSARTLLPKAENSTGTKALHKNYFFFFFFFAMKISSLVSILKTIKKLVKKNS